MVIKSMKQPLVEVVEDPEKEAHQSELLEEKLPSLHRQNVVVVEDGWDISDSSDEEKKKPSTPPAAPSTKQTIMAAVSKSLTKELPVLRRHDGSKWDFNGRLEAG